MIQATLTKNLILNQNADFEYKFQLINKTTGIAIDLTGATLRAQMRRTAGAPVAYDFESEIIQANEGIARFFMEEVDTLLVSVDVSDFAERQITPYSYDMYITFADGSEWRMQEGVMSVSPTVTLPEEP